MVKKRGQDSKDGKKSGSKSVKSTARIKRKKEDRLARVENLSLRPPDHYVHRATS